MIYFDNAATTKPSDNVLNEFVRASNTQYANPGSIHAFGMENRVNIDRIRLNILKTLNLSNKDYEVIFTGGATESNNLAIQGFCLRNAKRFNHIMTSVYEHSSVLNVFKHLETLGFKVDYIKVTPEGVLDLNDLKEHLDGKPVFASFMGANNEIGTTNDYGKIRELIGEDSILHGDLVQAIGKTRIDFTKFDLFNFTSHKIYGLKGCACLIKKKKINISPIVYGGNQEEGLRSGTLDYPSISAFSVAISDLFTNYETEYKKAKEIRDYLVKELGSIDGVALHDFPTCCPYILSLSLTKKKASVVVEALSNKEIFVNSVSACYSKSEVVSYVLKTINRDDIEAKNPIRISIGKYNTLEEAKIFVKEFKEILESIRS